MKPPRWSLPQSVKHIQSWLFLGRVKQTDVWLNTYLGSSTIPGEFPHIRLNHDWGNKGYQLFLYHTHPDRKRLLKLIQPYFTDKKDC